MTPNLLKKRSKGYEQFDIQKYKDSIARSELPAEHIPSIIKGLGNINNYFTTAQLCTKTYKLILKQSKTYAANYNLKRAVYALGPTGYPFEKLCAQILKAKGYEIEVSVVKEGKFVRHEIDVVAKREDNILYCECKFHSNKSQKNDVKIPLYVNSRWMDLQANLDFKVDYALLSNTPFSKDAVAYAKGVGMKLYSLNDPSCTSLLDMIKKYKVYPVTSLRSLSLKHKKALLQKGIVTIKQVSAETLEEEGVEPQKIEKILQEVKILTRPN